MPQKACRQGCMGQAEGKGLQNAASDAQSSAQAAADDVKSQLEGAVKLYGMPPHTACLRSLQQLQGHDDVKFASRCRATVSPQICSNAPRILRAQAWSHSRMTEPCDKFDSARTGAASERQWRRIGPRHEGRSGLSRKGAGAGG